MKLTPAGLLDHARSDEGRKQLRYAGVSLVFVPLGQVFVQILNYATDIPDPLCILIVACVLTVPNYYANKVYVWKDTSRDNLRTQMLVFWVAAMLGTGFAMGLAAISDYATRDSSAFWKGAWLFVAQLTGYGIVWIARYFFLDLWLFKATHHGEEPTAEEEAEMHADFPI
jgi:hypothetical protein